MTTECKSMVTIFVMDPNPQSPPPFEVYCAVPKTYLKMVILGTTILTLQLLSLIPVQLEWGEELAEEFKQAETSAAIISKVNGN
jgi:hypothetical protein